jgi:phosphatidylglycerol:prolipoprotein diacylglycerol transferase
MPLSFSWNIDPVLLEWGPVSLHWYGLLFAGAFVLGFYVMQRIYKLEARPQVELDSLLLHIIVGTVLGARLAHCLFYDPQYFLAHPWEILMVWRGGLASHGGAVGVLLGAFWFCRGNGRPPYLWLLDRLAIAAVLAGALIRIGNFFNSEIVGNPAQWFGVIFERVDSIPRHPVQLYEALAYFATFAWMWWVYRNKQPREGLLTALYLITVFAARFLLEFLKTPQAEYEQDFAISVGQWLSVPFIAAGVAVLIHSHRTRRASAAR